MALVNCPECNKEISDKATACPNCGNPIATEHVSETKESSDSPKSTPARILNDDERKMAVRNAKSNKNNLRLIFIVFGGILCFTGIGAIVGAPLIIAALIPGNKDINNATWLTGACPVCSTEIVLEEDKTLPCAKCKKKITANGSAFYAYHS